MFAGSDTAAQAAKSNVSAPARAAHRGWSHAHLRPTTYVPELQWLQQFPPPTTSLVPFLPSPSLPPARCRLLLLFLQAYRFALFCVTRHSLSVLSFSLLAGLKQICSCFLAPLLCITSQVELRHRTPLGKRVTPEFLTPPFLSPRYDIRTAFSSKHNTFCRELL